MSVKMSVNSLQPTWHHIPEDGIFYYFYNHRIISDFMSSRW